jgi:hypothetical protein
MIEEKKRGKRGKGRKRKKFPPPLTGERLGVGEGTEITPPTLIIHRKNYQYSP